MSADGSVVLNWGGEERRFRLRIGELRELQELINKPRGAHAIGPWSLYKLVARMDGWPDDMREIIRLGLIGGGTRIELVPGLVKRYFDERPLLESAPVAAAILGAALVPDESDPVGQKKTAEAVATTPTNYSNFQFSTAPGPQSDSTPARSTDAAFGNSPLVSTDGTGRTAPLTTITPE